MRQSADAASRWALGVLQVSHDHGADPRTSDGLAVVTIAKIYSALQRRLRQRLSKHRWRQVRPTGGGRHVLPAMEPRIMNEGFGIGA